MLFKTNLFSATWDTWMYHYLDRFYLYYLISEKSNGEGFGVATSEDGVHWQDHGLAVSASNHMVDYLGTGAVWKSPDFDQSGKFICNYSEWRDIKDIRIQTIYFAWSHDLIHWNKFGDDYAFQIEETYYETDQKKGGRWDCIYPVAKADGGYYGYWTAKPKDSPGFGFGLTTDGIHWKALKPPDILWKDIVFSRMEAGAVKKINNQYYCMIGVYPKGMFTLIAETPEGPFRPAEKNFSLLASDSFPCTYFARFIDTPDGLLVNHHATKREKNLHGRPITYLALLKRAVVDQEGTLRLAWWEGNEKIKGTAITDVNGQFDRSLFQKGIIIEGRMTLPGKICLSTAANQVTEFIAGRKGIAEVWHVGNSAGHSECREKVDRMMRTGMNENFRIIVKDSLVEFYLNDILLLCYTLEDEMMGPVRFDNIQDVRIWGFSGAVESHMLED